MASKTRTIIFLAALALLGSLVFAWYAMATDGPLAPPSYLVVPKTLTNGLPVAFHRVDRQSSSPTVTNWDLWIKRSGQFYHAHAFRAQNATSWVWVFDGHRVVLDAISAWANTVAVRAAGVKGPTPIRNLGKTPTLCKNVAPSVLVNVGTDAGGLIPLPEGQAYPDGGVVSCNGRYLLASRYGGRVAYLGKLVEEVAIEPIEVVDAGIPPRLDAGPPPLGGSTIGLLPNSPNWGAIDAATMKYCGQVPIGVSCP